LVEWKVVDWVAPKGWLMVVMKAEMSAALLAKHLVVSKAGGTAL
jgi:hypothetical protein